MAIFLICAFLVLLGFAGTAYASQGVPPDSDSWVDLLRPVLDALATGKPFYSAAVALVFAVALTRKYGAKRYPFLATDAGGSALVLAGSFFGAMAAALKNTTWPNLDMAYQAVLIAISASGGYTLLKRLVVDPFLRPLANKAPAWLRPVFAALLFVFDGKAAKVAEAEKAGADAVKANPGKGVAGVVGSPRDIE